MSRRSRRYLRQSPDRDGKGEHPHRYSVHGSHLLGRCHGRVQATSPTRYRPALFPPRDHDSRQALRRGRQRAASRSRSSPSLFKRTTIGPNGERIARLAYREIAYLTVASSPAVSCPDSQAKSGDRKCCRRHPNWRRLARCVEDLIDTSAIAGMPFRNAWRTREGLPAGCSGPRSIKPVMTSAYEVLRCRIGQLACVAFSRRAAAAATRRADVREAAGRRSVRNEKIFVQFLGNSLLCIYASVMSGAPKAARTRASRLHRAGSLPGERDLRGKEPFGQPSKYLYQAPTADRCGAHRDGRPGRCIRPR